MRRPFLALPLTLLLLGGCAQKESYTIGLLAPLSGEFSIYGEAIQRGARLAYEDLQASDFPVPLELAVADSKSDIETGKAELSKLYEDGALGVIGGVMSAEAIAYVSVADRFDRVLLSPSASSPELTGISKNFYRVFPSDFLEGTKMGNFAAQKLGLENVVILALAEPYAKGVQQVFEAEFVRQGGTVVETLEFPASLTDFKDIVQHARSLESDGMFIAAFALDVADMLKELRAGGYEGRIITTSAFATTEGLRAAGEAADGVYLSQTVFDLDSEEPQVRSFVEAFRAKYGSDPGIYEAHGYDAMKMMAQALVEGEIRTPTDYWQALRRLREFPGVTGKLQFDERGDVQKFPRVYVVKDGVLFDYESDVAERRQELQEKLRSLREERMRKLQGQPDGSGG